MANKKHSIRRRISSLISLSKEKNSSKYLQLSMKSWLNSLYLEEFEQIISGTTLSYHCYNHNQWSCCQHCLARFGYGVPNGQGKRHGTSQTFFNRKQNQITNHSNWLNEFKLRSKKTRSKWIIFQNLPAKNSICWKFIGIFGLRPRFSRNERG